jgi:branched-chain amino acid aminotransferase
MGLTVEERRINIDELISGYKSGELTEIFGTGTAATISPIKELRYHDHVLSFDVNNWKIAPKAKKRLTDIREGKSVDKYGWMFPV